MLNNKENEKIINKGIKKVSEDIENLKYNTAVSTLMTMLNEFNANKKILSINYLGTMDEWNGTLGKTSSWKNGNTSIKKIICSDGEITL